MNLSDEDIGDGGGDEWLATWADAITLLMAFFVMMFAIETGEDADGKMDQVLNSINKNLGKKPVLDPGQGGPQNGNDSNIKTHARPNPMAPLRQAQSQMVVLQADVRRSRDGKTLEFELFAGDMFDPGSAKIRAGMDADMQRVADAIQSISEYRPDYAVTVEGYTDDSPISTAAFPSNWELSASRAAHVVRYLVDGGLDAERLTAAGYGETRPKVPNRDDNGRPIAENQKKNRRIVIRVEH